MIGCPYCDHGNPRLPYGIHELAGGIVTCKARPTPFPQLPQTGRKLAGLLAVAAAILLGSGVL